MQQAPSTEQYRKMFVAKPGWKLVDSDYSSAELFIAAISQETSSYCLQLSKGMTFTVTLHF
jgi:DNA polymerase I-like protein with 3'-5' exonuclease and polymerase domains